MIQPNKYTLEVTGRDLDLFGYAVKKQIEGVKERMPYAESRQGRESDAREIRRLENLLGRISASKENPSGKFDSWAELER